MVWNNRLLAHCTGKHIFEFGKKVNEIQKNPSKFTHSPKTWYYKKQNNTGTNGTKNQ